MPSTILVTGATGRLGTAVCRALTAAGHVVRATDRRFERDFVAPLTLGDLQDELFVYRVLEGCDAVVHLGNHANQYAGPSPQQLLSDNMAMNANVFHAASELGVQTVVFASSVQVTIKRERHLSEPPYSIPYLPLDGELPCNPGRNTYAQSKEFAERMLRLMVEADSTLSAAAVRFPMLVTDAHARRFQAATRIPLGFIDFAECTAHLFLPDAGKLVVDLVEQRPLGYRQYFPATAMDIQGYTIRELLDERYGDVNVRKPVEDYASLIDISAIRSSLGWAPEQRLRAEVER